VAVGSSLAHEALFYRDAGELVARAAPVLRSALAAGEPALVAAPGPHADLLAAALGPAAGRVRLVDMTRAGRNPGRIIPWVLHTFLDEHAGRPVCIVGEPIWAGRTAAEYPACVQHEAMVNLAFAGRVATILCTYDTRRLPADALRDAARTHPVLVDGDERRHSPSYADPDTVVGEFNRPLPDPPAGAAALDFDAGTLSGVRDFVGWHGARAGLRPYRCDDFQMAAHELATNAVTHGGGTGRVTVWPAAGQVLCDVRDRGRAVVRLAGRVPPAPDSLGGRGLVLVNYLCDLVRIHTGRSGTAVRLYFDI
jgi:anti-sigma regulatory factor (Ser/Thr protein kinase)